MLESLAKTVDRVGACRLCSSDDLVDVLDMGHTAIAYRLLDAEQLDDPEPTYPLVVCRCGHCGLVQLRHAVNPRLLYPPDYPYDMDTSTTAHEHFNELAADVGEAVDLEAGDLVVDIGGNTGVLLDEFHWWTDELLNVEPAMKMARRSGARGIKTMVEFFDPDVARDIRERYGQAKAVVATNVINQVDDLRGFLEGVETLLEPDGRFVFETPDLRYTIEDLHYDHVYHEHSTFWSAGPLETIGDVTGLHVVDVEEVNFRGGSLRVSLARERPQEPVLPARPSNEGRRSFEEAETWETFASGVSSHRNSLRAFIAGLNQEGADVAVIGVTAKGNSLLNYAGITKDDVVYATEIQDTKVGRYTPGGHIPIVHDDRLLEDVPDYALITAWNFAPEIMDNLREYEQQGGRFMLPMPEPHVVEPTITA